MDKFYYSERFRIKKDPETSASSMMTEQTRLTNSAHMHGVQETLMVSHLIGYRQKVAQDILSCRDEHRLEMMKEIMDDVNDKIRNALSL